QDRHFLTFYQLRDRVVRCPELAVRAASRREGSRREGSPRVAYSVLQPPAFFTVAIRTPLD
ncbi:MAG: hypothetical protein ACYTXY_48040, partial [Nostoc sp.]